MRLFVALWPPTDVVAELAAALDGLCASCGDGASCSSTAPTAGLRWTAPAQWHLTLAFLGEVDDGRLPELARRLSRTAARHAPLTLQFRGAGRFGDRVLYTKVTGRRVPLGYLAGSVAAAARRTGVLLDERPYRPHLTLARARPGHDLRPLVAALQDYRSAVWTPSAVELVHSRLGAGPDRTSAYQTIASWPLTGR